MRHLFLKIKKNYILKNRFLAFQILTMIFSIVLLYSLFYNKKLSDYQVVEGNVEGIGLSKIKNKTKINILF